MFVRGSRGRSAEQSYDDAFVQATEFVLGPVLLGLVGWFLDGRLGTAPFLLVVLGVAGFVGTGVAHYFRYMDRVARHDEGKPWTRRTQ